MDRRLRWSERVRRQGLEPRTRGLRDDRLAALSWVKSDCQHSFGCSAANLMQEDLGRLAGSGVTNPARARYRLTVAADTLTW
jgi:hypothetical protein